MRIAVLLKEVPDTYSDREMNLETGLTDRTGEVAADEVGERAVEAALLIAEKLGKDDVHVEVLSVGPEQAAESVRRGIAMGANDATMVTDDRLIGADATMTATTSLPSFAQSCLRSWRCRTSSRTRASPTSRDSWRRRRRS